MMTREELTDRIATGSAFLQRTDITDEQIERARAKIDSYREMLRNLDENEESSKEKAQRNIEAIRSLLSKKLGRVRDEPSQSETM